MRHVGVRVRAANDVIHGPIRGIKSYKLHGVEYICQGPVSAYGYMYSLFTEAMSLSLHVTISNKHYYK